MESYRKIEILDQKIRDLRMHVLKATGFSDVKVLNVYISGKLQDYLDVLHQTYDHADLFKAKWLQGFSENIKEILAKPRDEWREKDTRKYMLFLAFQKDDKVRQFVDLTLERSYLKKYPKYIRVKPSSNEILWLGDNKYILGIPIKAQKITYERKPGEVIVKWMNYDTGKNYQFPADFWTIGHILISGLIDYSSNEVIKFESVDEILNFYIRYIENQSTPSCYEIDLAKRYCDYVRGSPKQESIPFLIPQFRFGGIEVKHQYRLDFMIINPFTQKKYGLELSPYSTHKQKKQYERDSRKMNNFIEQYDVTMLNFSDQYLKDIDALFEHILPYLNPQKPEKKALSTALNDLLSIVSS